MIKREDLLPIAKLKGLRPNFAELDYLQDIALLNIYREFGSKLIFKGGTCLYKIYKLNRFSEYLDFTIKKGFRPKDFFGRLPFFFNLLNIKTRISVKQFERGINVYLECAGPLYDGRKETIATLVFNISSRERILLPAHRCAYLSQYWEVRPFDLFAMDEKEIFAEKVRAIYERDKARDIYDLWYLLKKKGIPFDTRTVIKKLAQANLKFEKRKFLDKLEMKKTSWEQDLGALVAGQVPSFSAVKKEIEQSL